MWALSLLASLAVGVLLVRLEGASTTAQADREADLLGNACEMISESYSYYTSGSDGSAPPEGDAAYRQELATVVSVALAGAPGVSGGIWHVGEGALVGDPPDAAGFAALAASASSEERSELRETELGGGGAAETQLIAACPLRGPPSGMVAWAAGRAASAAGGRELWLGLGVLMALMLAISGWLTWLVSSWSRHVRGIEAALASHEAGGLPHLPVTGERELDRIIAALNTASGRLGVAQAHAFALSARVAAAERMAALGRVAAGVAHEIRNPIAAMRLKAENALAGDDSRRSAALTAILAQVARLDRLLGELLAMTQRRDFAPVILPLDDFLRAVAAEQSEPDRIVVDAPATSVRIDPALVRRVLDNLLRNALQHSPAGGVVRLTAEVSADALRIEVRDEGPGVPEALRTSLFEPFVTGRADGTGLGLAIAREFAEAHGGVLTLLPDGPGAAFRLDLPQDPPCPQS